MHGVIERYRDLWFFPCFRALPLHLAAGRGWGCEESPDAIDGHRTIAEILNPACLTKQLRKTYLANVLVDPPILGKIRANRRIEIETFFLEERHRRNCRYELGNARNNNRRF